MILALEEKHCIVFVCERRVCNFTIAESGRKFVGGLTILLGKLQWDTRLVVYLLSAKGICMMKASRHCTDSVVCDIMPLFYIGYIIFNSSSSMLCSYSASKVYMTHFKKLFHRAHFNCATPTSRDHPLTSSYCSASCNQ